METEPEGTVKKYIFLVANQDIAMNIVMSGYQAIYMGRNDDEYYILALALFLIILLSNYRQ